MGDLAKITLQSPDPDREFKGLATELQTGIGAAVTTEVQDTHIVLTLSATNLDAARSALGSLRPALCMMRGGTGIEICKEVGLPRDVAARFDLAAMSGTHGIGHTRMATEFAVTTVGAHLFSTGADQCLVHNGSLSNHNSVRRTLKRAGMTFQTENDTGVAAAFLTHKLHEGANLGEAMAATLTDLDGFFILVVGTSTALAWCATPSPASPP